MTYRILYLGLNAPKPLSGQSIIHYPVIRIEPKPLVEVRPAFHKILNYTHFIFTSQTSVNLFSSYLPECGVESAQLNNKFFIAVGKSTAQSLKNNHLPVNLISKIETAEGIIEEINAIDLSKASVFWPRSALARPVLSDYFKTNGLRCEECVLYNTVFHLPGPLPHLDLIDEIAFTSPSTVDAYLHFFGKLPNKKLTAIGPVTAAHLRTLTTNDAKDDKDDKDERP